LRKPEPGNLRWKKAKGKRTGGCLFTRFKGKVHRGSGIERLRRGSSSFAGRTKVAVGRTFTIAVGGEFSRMCYTRSLANLLVKKLEYHKGEKKKEKKGEEEKR